MSGINEDKDGIEVSESGEANEPLPFVAPCNEIEISAPFEWLKGGWEDYKKTPGLSLAWGVFAWLLSTFIAWLAWKLGGWVLLLSMLSGFIFVAPLLAFALYSVSRQLCIGNKPCLL